MKLKIFGHTETDIQAAILKDHTDLCARGHCLANNIVARYDGLAGIRGRQPTQDTDQGGFASTIRSQKSSALSFCNLKIYSIKNVSAAKSLYKAINRDGS